MRTLFLLLICTLGWLAYGEHAVTSSGVVSLRHVQGQAGAKNKDGKNGFKGEFRFGLKTLPFTMRVPKNLEVIKGKTAPAESIINLTYTGYDSRTFAVTEKTSETLKANKTIAGDPARELKKGDVVETFTAYEFTQGKNGVYSKRAALSPGGEKLLLEVVGGEVISARLIGPYTLPRSPLIYVTNGGLRKTGSPSRTVQRDD